MGAKIYMATTKGEHVYTDVPYDPDVYIMFGPESHWDSGGDPD